jgi:hypothetical protein
MGMWQVRLALGLLVGAGWVISWPAIDLAAEKPPANAEGAAKTEGAGEAPKADEAAVAKIEKQITGIEDRMKSLQQEDARASMAQVAAQGAAGGADVEEIRKQLANGSKKKEHLEYRAAMESAAGQWKALSEKYDRIVNMAKTLERDREKATPALQAKIDELSKRVADKYRSTLEKVVTCFTRCANYKNAVQAQLIIYQMTPEAKRDREMKKELAGLYKNAGDTKNSLALYKSMLDAVPEKERFKNRQLVEEVAAACKDAGDFHAAIQLYKGLLDAIPEKDRGKDKNPDLSKALADLYEKSGDLRDATVTYKAYWDASDKKDWGTGEKLGDLCDKLGDPRTALTVYQAAYDAMNDGEKKDSKKGGKLLTKIQLIKSKLGIRGSATDTTVGKKAGK